MDFRITISRPPFAVDFEVGSMAEAIGALEQEGSQIAKMFDTGAALLNMPVTQGQEQPQLQEAEAPKRTRGKNKNQPDPATATAPPPMPVPGAPAAPLPPVVTTAAPPMPPAVAAGTEGLEIPGFLKREAPAAAAPPPPPPVLQNAPPTAPVAPQIGVLAGKVATELERRSVGAPDGGKSLVDWLAALGLVTPGASFPEAVSVVRFRDDAELAQAAAGLQIS